MRYSIIISSRRDHSSFVPLTKLVYASTVDHCIIAFGVYVNRPDADIPTFPIGLCVEGADVVYCLCVCGTFGAKGAGAGTGKESRGC